MRRNSHLHSGPPPAPRKRSRSAQSASPLITVEKPPQCEEVERPIPGLPFKVTSMEFVTERAKLEPAGELKATPSVPPGLTPVPSDKPEPAFGTRLGRLK